MQSLRDPAASAYTGPPNFTKLKLIFEYSNILMLAVIRLGENADGELNSICINIYAYFFPKEIMKEEKERNNTCITLLATICTSSSEMY